ncbi:2-oxoacid dehydrogenases acyltransferase (catalytic domain) [Sinosporangium album]|uniref:2-oxoacid dehydrogenases acyltransferase (Catalytic domain) n=1 Tax=Sinosporangium album TaxID=504805 RepID=A0A1G7YFF6_9ACTN|nr:2-oxo acid dehydrogenase subunit E2 [Sinosporangium album]SDG95009.1 2-oxoacid dehydrogenases acyltransferase (catalytic domain) [Sinosporangium album]
MTARPTGRRAGGERGAGEADRRTTEERVAAEQVVGERLTTEGVTREGVGTERVVRERRHTLYFLDEIRPFSPVFLDTEVNMSAVLAHRRAGRAQGLRRSVVTYVVRAAAGVLAVHPEANAAIRGWFNPRVARFGRVHAKITLDKTVGGRRVVLSAVLRDVDRADLDEVQRQVERFRDGDAETMDEFAGARLLHRLPVLVGRVAYRRVVRPLRRRPELFGTFAVTSLGHRPVDGFYSVGGTTVTLGVGRIADRPVVLDGVLGVAPTMRLSLAFDHRVIDGAEAADVLAEIKDALEKAAEF